MDPYAEVTCVLKMDSKCKACKMHAMEILGSVCGMYSFDVNSEEGLARLQAVVEPNLFFRAVARTGPHAESKLVKISHPKFNQRCYDYATYNAYSNGYNALGPYNHSRALPDYSYRTMEPAYPHYHGSNPYYHRSNSYYHGFGLPQQRYVSSYPP
ncbi:hypothetical protein AAHA92_29690 [Salvia divinorum]|uniref:HMA domain-containing protein n=1 Tax=Salvia divinorum TaxID=28513 RepID=A0ABD1FZ77_SALDI